MNYKKITITGNVQGVGFREFIRREASKIRGLAGYVKNLNSGNVVVVARGDEDKVKQLIEKCRRGPLLASVKDVSVDEIELDAEYNNFIVKL